MEKQPVTQITTAQKQHREFDGCKYMFHFRLIKHKGVTNMTVTTLIFPLKDTFKKIGKNGIAFRACTSMKKTGKQSKEYAANYDGMFFDCIAFDNGIINTIREATKDKKGIDINAYAELNIWTSKTKVEHKDIVFRIMGATVHEKTTKPTDCPF